MTDQRFSKAEFAAWIGIIGNIALAAIKGSVGFVSNSKALIADAAHSASDVAGSVAVLVGLKAAKKPPDEDHPYGHGKAESIAAIIVSVLLLLVGFEVGMAAVKAIYHGVGKPSSYYGWAIGVIVFSIVVKEAMFQYKYRLGKKLSSHALIANAWEHRSDVYSSAAALIGVGGAMLGVYLGYTWMYYLDPVAGLLVSVMVLRMGYRLIMDSIHTTLDHVLHEEEAKELLEAVERVKGVIAVNELRAREHGHYVIVDTKISVNPKITVMEGHDIAKMVKHYLLSRFSHVSDVFVHVNPYDPGYPYKTTMDSDQSDQPTIIH